MWREGLGAYKIITENKSGYRNHPAIKEFEKCQGRLYLRLYKVREEMIARGYHPKELPVWQEFGNGIFYVPIEEPWQTLDEQIEILKAKGCKCKI